MIQVIEGYVRIGDLDDIKKYLPHMQDNVKGLLNGSSLWDKVKIIVEINEDLGHGKVQF